MLENQEKNNKKNPMLENNIGKHDHIDCNVMS